MLAYGYSRPALELLDHDLRAFALVGGFMGFFALLEQGINAAIGEVLEVKGIPATIITRNMTFDDKIKTLRTLVDCLLIDSAEAKRFDGLAKRARKIGETRNVVAHTPFRRSEKTDGVEFFAVSATSSLKFPEMDWSIDEFIRQVDEINAVDNDLRSIESKMTRQRIAKALMKRAEDPVAGKPLFGGLFGLGARC